MSDITLYSHAGGPNGWKTAIILEELGVNYNTEFPELPMQGPKPESFLKLNPNGRIPIIVDHKNNDFTLWESGAIIQYLVEKYDKEGKLGGQGNDKHLVAQWLAFQISGQGPYFGQAFWFSFYQPLPEAAERFKKEIRRIWGVLDRALEGKEYLVGNQVTVADLTFINWNVAILGSIFKDQVDIDSEYPNFAKWHKTLLERPSVKKIFADKEAANAH